VGWSSLAALRLVMVDAAADVSSIVLQMMMELLDLDAAAWGRI
jgi:hypothetical protein